MTFSGWIILGTKKMCLTSGSDVDHNMDPGSQSWQVCFLRYNFMLIGFRDKIYCIRLASQSHLDQSPVSNHKLICNPHTRVCVLLLEYATMCTSKGIWKVVY